MDKPFQRVGSVSNAHVGREFELVALKFFLQQNIPLHPNHKVEVGVGPSKKFHAFDLGCSEQRVIVECKSHRWTAGHNIPSAKLTVWNEAMYYFHVSPPDYRKIMFVLKDLRRGNSESLRSTICAHMTIWFQRAWSFGSTINLCVVPRALAPN